MKKPFRSGSLARPYTVSLACRERAHTNRMIVRAPTIVRDGVDQRR